MLRKGGINCFSPEKKGVYNQFISSEQERLMSQSSDKSRKIEQLSTLPSLQDGKSAFNKGSVATKRLSVQNRPDRCLFFHSTPQQLLEVYALSLRRELVGITFLCFERGPVSLCNNYHAL